MSINDRIAALRSAMQAARLDAYLIPSSDPHQSEYVAEHYGARSWISGFSGSAGLIIVTPNHAGLWTDSRYFLQAEQQLNNSEVELHKLRVPHTPEHLEWLQDQLPKGARLGFDGGVVSQSQWESLEKALSRKDIELDGSHDLFVEVWADRPALPRTDLYTLSAKETGESRASKLKRLRQDLEKHQLEAYLFVALDDIAWLLNIRASDVDFNPLAYAYLLLEGDKAHLFTHTDRVADEVKAELMEDGVQLYAYDALADFLEQFPADQIIGVDVATISSKLYQHVGQERTYRLPSPVVLHKAQKNETEIDHLRQCMRMDGLALVRLYRWLEAVLEEREITEDQIAEQLAVFRAQGVGYVQESFPAIVGYRSNGAIIHYRPEAGRSAVVRKEGMLLLDSGGQYRSGTTDVTRTVHLGEPTAIEKFHFTLVLQGFIALDRAHFPPGTTGVQLDILARLPLWMEGLNYGHGTGHGVGFFLNVHEGPQSFSPNARSAKSQTAFVPGMVTSNEPGYYSEGEYGIRTENLVLCKKADPTEVDGFLCFESLTLFPIDRKLVDFSRLSFAELTWLRDYHERVYRELSPLLEDEEKQWLEAACSNWGRP